MKTNTCSSITCLLICFCANCVSYFPPALTFSVQSASLIFHMPLCRLRIFCIAESDDNSIQMEQDLALFLRLLRIDADVHVVELMNNEISAHALNRAKHLEVN